MVPAGGGGPVSYGVARGALWCVLMAGGGAGMWALLVPLVTAESAAPARSTGADVKPTPAFVSDSLVERAIRRPMFRSGRRPATVGFDPARGSSPDASVGPPIPKPALLVSGIVWGHEPAAVVEGMPGVEGATVMRQGERMAGIRVVLIERERVLLRGLDTTWNLPVREPWK